MIYCNILIAEKFGKSLKENLKFRQKQNHITFEYITDYQTVTLSDADDITKAFSNYFADIGSKLTSSYVTANNNTVLFPTNLPYSLFLKPIIEQEILLQIGALNQNKSTVISGIPIKFIKLTAGVRRYHTHFNYFV